MSLVAFLAGEDHSDAPRTASPLIQTFAVSINDHMPHRVRQRLKAFAPRIIGTNDGLDEERARLLRQLLAEEVLARAPGQDTLQPAVPATGGFLNLRRLWRWFGKDAQHHLFEVALSSGDDRSMASEAARLIARRARNAVDAREQEWYWNAAIGVLDRLCDVGAQWRQAPGIPAERLAQLEALSAQHQDRGRRKEARSALDLLHW
ncbi:hypothetical protein [Siccirubricoccus deserti]|uniref:Uncharacterized protein n=1 Tax=Siccirubricoccus deserti TaxID=2013562 RepID=A0A9X0R1S3_9PROT|nr:hypothetical protein [Siccirubricoccus deserti]MBC4018074.1 hypothetical protein [Siccirubricoccus deserti]